MRPPASVAVDPLATELARCRTITPEQNASDDTCRRVWAESGAGFSRASSPRPNAAANDPATAVPGKDQDRLPSAGVQPERGECTLMGGTGVIDHFLEVFTRYIDSGFGLLSGEVAFIATTLIVDRHDAGGAVLVVGRR